MTGTLDIIAKLERASDQRQREIEQGLRDEGGALTFSLVVEEYAQGAIDYDEGKPPPKLSTPSYDLGRDYGRRRQAEKAEDRAVLLGIKREQERRHQSVRAFLIETGRLDLLADYDARIAALSGCEGNGTEEAVG